MNANVIVEEGPIPAGAGANPRSTPYTPNRSRRSTGSVAHRASRL